VVEEEDKIKEAKVLVRHLG